MEQPDSAMTQRVWQRVTAQPMQPGPETLKTLIAMEMQTRQTLLPLAKQMPHHAHTLMQMASHCGRHIRTLQGIHTLTEGCRADVRAAAQSMATSPNSLRRLYGTSLKLATQYAARRDDEQYGLIFDAMAVAKAQHCATLLELLGTL